MTILNILLKIESEDEDEYYGSIYIKIENDGIKTSIKIDEPYLYPLNKWYSFLENIKNNKNDKMEFCRSNGECNILCDDKNIIFQVSKSGNGGEGRVVVKLDKFKHGAYFYENMLEVINDNKFIKLYDYNTSLYK